MTFDEFVASLASDAPPVGVSTILQGLWFDRKGEWTRAHEIAQGDHTRDGSRLHAYLHRREGDLPNANYWHSRAGSRMPEVSLDEKWESLVRDYLER